MKTLYIKQLYSEKKVGLTVELLCWLKGRRHHGSVIFLDLADSTGSIQAVLSKKESRQDVFEIADKVPLESAIMVKGEVVIDAKNSKKMEIRVYHLEVIGEATINMSPQPRSDFDIFDPSLTRHLLSKRHVYLRNPKVMAIMRFRHLLMSHMRNWFNTNGFIEINAPILTPVPLYEDETAMSIIVNDERVFLTQCVGYYLEAAVHAFERVYNMGPSFRGEESRSKRHLMEYWHIKAELAFGNREDIMALVEQIIKYLTEKCHESSVELLETLGTKMCLDGLKIPYERIDYEDAIRKLQNQGADIEFGDSLSSAEEETLSRLFKGPFWVVGIPRDVEPFPYVVDASDTRKTMVADLIASRGFGELLGVAEKIHTLEMLDERMKDKGKLGDPRYEWVREVHQLGCVPHIAFGMGVERLIRWLLNMSHVRDAIPFPRIFRRKVYP